MTLRLTGLNIYPIKSARGIALGESDVDDFGLRHDCRWMVEDPAGIFLSQRDHPRLALVVPRIRNGTLEVNAPGMSQLQLAPHPQDTVATSATVWDDTCPATRVGDRSAELGFTVPARPTRPADSRT